MLICTRLYCTANATIGNRQLVEWLRTGPFDHPKGCRVCDTMPQGATLLAERWDRSRLRGRERNDTTWRHEMSLLSEERKWESGSIRRVRAGVHYL